MNTTDFTQPGGFPLTQDVLKFLQDNIINTLVAFGKIPDYNGTAYILTGCSNGTGGGVTTVNPGYFYYNGDIIYMPGNAITVVGGNSAYIQIVSTVTTLTYQNGSTPAVQTVKTGLLMQQATGTANDATHFLLSNLVTYPVALGIVSRDSGWQTLTVATGAGYGTVTGTVKYKKNYFSNTLQIQGLLNTASPADFNASPNFLYSVMGTLAPGYVAGTTPAYFSAYNFGDPCPVSDDGVQYINNILCAVNSGGELAIQWIKPAGGVASYDIVFNALIPLD